MTKFIVDKKSWHYRFIRYVDLMSSYTINNFCDYWRVFVFSCLATFFFFIFLLGMFGLTLVLLYYIFMNPMLGLLLGIFIVLQAIFDYLFKPKTKKISKNKGLFRTKYDSWKEKHCPLIEYK